MLLMVIVQPELQKDGTSGTGCPPLPTYVSKLVAKQHTLINLYSQKMLNDYFQEPKRMSKRLQLLHNSKTKICRSFTFPKANPIFLTTRPPDCKLNWAQYNHSAIYGSTGAT